MNSKRQFLHVWGVLAGALAENQSRKSLVVAVLKQMKQYIVFESDFLDATFYKQRVWFCYGDFLKEEKYFRIIFSKVPTVSSFHYISCKTHGSSRIFEIIKIMAKAIIRTDLNEKIVEKIESFKELTRSIFTTTRDKRTLEMIETQRGIIQWLEMAVQRRHHPEKAILGSVIRHIAALLKKASHPYIIMVHAFLRTITISHAQTFFENYRRKVEGVTRRRDAASHGNFLFTQYTLATYLRVGVGQNSGFAEQLLQQAIDIYTKCNHENLALAKSCQNFEPYYSETEVAQTDAKRRRLDDVIHIKNADHLMRLLADDDDADDVPEKIRFGINSCARHDLCYQYL